MRLFAHIRRHPWIAVFWITAAWACWLLLERAWFEAQGTLHDDVHTYMAVGHGILNGLAPYRDLFESKPPGIFLLSALSILLFDGPALLKGLQIVALLAIPAGAIGLAWPTVNRQSEPMRTTLLLGMFIAGCALALYAFAVSGEGLVEPLTTATCVLFALCYARSPERMTWHWSLLSALAIVAAVGLKEPAILVLFAIALLLGRSWKHALYGFVIPLLLAVAAGAAVLLVIGFLEPYITIYLRHMLGFHLTQLDHVNGPLLLRGVLVNRTVYNLWDYAHTLPLAVIGILLGCAFFAWRRGSVLTIVRLACSLFLLQLAIGAGGDFYAHHFVFAVAGYVVLAWMFAEGIIRSRDTRLASGFGVFVTAMLVISFFWYKHPEYDAKIRWWQERSAVLRRAATAIDTVMDRCAVDRYLFITDKGAGPFGFTRHSPSGPVFIQFSRFIHANPAYMDAFRTALSEDRLIVMNADEPTNLTDTAKQYVNQNFTFVPWECAKPYDQPIPYKILFRNPAENGGDSAP